MRRKMILVGLGLTFLINGCTMIPEYSRPEAPIPKQWPSGTSYQQEATPANQTIAAELKWRDFFTDEPLRKIIEIALQNNRDLRVAALNVERARAYYRIQHYELAPKVDAAGSFYQERIPDDLSTTGSAKTVEEYRTSLGLNAWEIDFFGRIRSLSQKALEEYFATQQARRGAQILLISEVANTYLTLAADREMLQLAQSTLAAQQTAYQLIKRRFEVGVVPELDLRQVQSQVETSRVEVAIYTEKVARDENALNLLAGYRVPAGLSPQTLSALSPVRGISAGTSSIVLLNRPDILQAENRLKGAYANIGAARAAFFPRISLTTAIGTASDDLSGLFDSGSGTWLFSPRIAIPVFDPRTWSALTVTQVERDIAVAQYEGSIQAAFRDVADTLAQRGMLGERMNAQQSLVDATLAAYRISNIRYEKGSDIYLNVLDAQRSLYSAQQGLITTRLANFTNQIQLYAVLGGGSV